MQIASAPKRLLNENETAQILGVKPQTLALWRCRERNTDLRFLRIGRVIRYRMEDVEQFIQSHAVGGMVG